MSKGLDAGSVPELSVYKEITNVSFGFVPIGPTPKTAVVVIYDVGKQSMSL